MKIAKTTKQEKDGAAGGGEDSKGPAGAWLTQLGGTMSLLGDKTKEQIFRGIEDTPLLMQDADGPERFDEVCEASVKWALGNSTDNEALRKNAHLELLDALAPGSVEPVKLRRLPLRDYIEAKEQFDFARGQYTTTGGVDTAPRADVMQLQRQLNAGNYRDKFGMPLKEDGILGARTAQAVQKLVEPVQTLKLEDAAPQPKELNELAQRKPEKLSAQVRSDKTLPPRPNGPDSAVLALNYGPEKDGSGGLNQLAKTARTEEARTLAKDTMAALSNF